MWADGRWQKPPTLGGDFPGLGVVGHENNQREVLVGASPPSGDEKGYSTLKTVKNMENIRRETLASGCIGQIACTHANRSICLVRHSALGPAA